MTEFKPGDQVRCINTNKHWLEFGRIYKVIRVDDDGFIYLDSVEHGWFSHRFELVTEKSEEADTVTFEFYHDEVEILESLIDNEIKSSNTEDDFYYIEQLFNIRKTVRNL